jgi:hypothetical protein
MLIWVAQLDKELLGYITVEEFCAMTGNSPGFLAERDGMKDGVEIYRTGDHIFGTLSASKGRPSLRWSIGQQRFERLHEKLKS